MGHTDSKKKLGHFELQVSEDEQDVAYLRLPTTASRLHWLTQP